MTIDESTAVEAHRSALAAGDVSMRLRAAMAAGAARDSSVVPLLVERCAVEPDFYVRDMLTWALLQQPRDLTVPLLRQELSSGCAQAHSQALHTLSKMGTPEAWPWIFPASLTDRDDEVARAAWRLAVAIVPNDQHGALADVLLSQVGRGDIEVLRSLARALGELSITEPSVRTRLEQLGDTGKTSRVRYHARAAVLLADDPRADVTHLLDRCGDGIKG